MLTTYFEVASAIRRNLPEIRWIDLDKGQVNQLITGELDYDLPSIPCVLISVPDEQWKSLSNKSQIGNGNLIVKLLLNLPSGTHASDPLLSMSVEATQLAEALHESIIQVHGIEERTRVRRYPVAHLFCIETHYTTKLAYLRAVRQKPKPDPLITSNLNFPISQQ